MEFSLKKDVLEIVLPERITYDTSMEFDREIFEIIDSNKFSKVILDGKNLEMISSAGLRVILKIKKQYNDLRIINANSQAYDVFEMTGFTTFIDVKRAFREVSLENAKLIGDGFFSKVYKLTDDTIVKVFINNSSIDDIEKELNLAKRAFVLGVPTAISFDIVKAGDNYGVVFEMLNAGLLRDIFKKGTDYEGTIIKYADLLKKVNTTEADSDAVPSQLELTFHKLETVKDYIDVEIYTKLKSLLESIGEGNTFLHNDCHIKNVMESNNELFLIDMETFSRGNPIFELSGIYETYLGFTGFYGDAQADFLGIPTELSERIFYDVSRDYFKNLSDEDYQENLKKIGCLAYATLLYWIKTYSTDEGFFEYAYTNVKKFINEVSDLKIKL